MSRRTTILGVLTTLLVAALVWVPAGAASAATLLTESNPLPLARYADHTIDTSRERIFITPGPGGDRLAVTDLQGELVDSRAGLPGAQAVALSADGTTLFVSLETGQVVELDPDSLDTRATYAVTTSTQPVVDLAWADGKLWVLGSRPYNQAVLSTLDRDTGSLVPTGVAVGGRTLAPTPTGVLVRKDLNDVVLSVGASGVIAERTFGWGVEVGSSTTGQPFVRDSASDPRIVLVDPATLETVRTTTLPQTTFATTDGTLAASAADYSRNHEVAVVDAATSQRINTFRVPFLHWEDAPYVTGLVLGPEGLVVFAEGPAGVTTWHEPLPGTSGTQVRLDVPDPSWIGRTTVVTGTLEDEGAPVAGAELTVTDRIWFNDDLPPRTRTLTTGADGSFSFDHVPRAWGETFLVEYAGDELHPPAIEEIDFSFHHQSTALEVNRPAGVAPGEPITFTGTLTALGDPVPDAAVLVEETCTGTERPFEVRTDDAGRFTADVVPGRCLDPIFRFSFGSGSWVYESVSTTRTVAVSWARPTISLVQPVAEQRAGSTFHWSGTLVRGGSPAPGTELTWEIRRYSSGSAMVEGTVETDESGHFTLDETIEHADRYWLAVRDAGDATTLAGSASVEFTVTRIPTTVRLDDEALESVPDEPVEIAGTVVTPDGSPVPDHEVQLDLGGIVRDTVVTDDTGRFSFTTVPPAPRDWTDSSRLVYGIVATQTSRLAESRAVVQVEISPAATRLVLDQVPSPTSPGDEVTLSGRLTTTAGSPLAGRTVSVVHTDGEQDAYTLTTDAEGRFAVRTTIRTGLTQELHASFAGTPAYGASSADQQWTGRPLPGSLTIDPVPTRLLGETVRLAGRLTTQAGDGGTADVTVTQLDGYGATVETYTPVSTAADGSFSLEVPADEVGRFTFVARSSVWDVAAQSASTAVEIRRLVLRTTALDPGASVKGWAVYGAARDPGLSTTATPARSGLCVSQEVQRLRRDRWRPVLTTTCTDTDADGTTSAVLDLRHPAGSRWRVRPYRESSVPTRGQWVKIRFR